jgi:hypothetical protein
METENIKKIKFERDILKVLYKYNYLKEKNIGNNNYNGKTIIRIDISLIGLGVPEVNIITKNEDGKHGIPPKPKDLGILPTII